MSTFQSLEEAQTYFVNDRFATLNGVHLDALTERGCVASMTLDERHLNANGGVMGGVMFTLADFAFAVACNNEHKPTVAINVNINYLSAPKGKALTATAEMIKSGKTTCVCNVMVRDDTGRDIALFVGTGYKL